MFILHLKQLKQTRRRRKRNKRRIVVQELSRRERERDEIVLNTDLYGDVNGGLTLAR